jgi:two-component system, LytTR family, response regulator
MPAAQSTNAISALVVDDEPLAREGVCRLLASHPVAFTILAATNGAEAVEVIRAQRPELVFLDVEMPEMDGFEVVQQVGVDAMPPVVFITAHDQYAIQAFEINAIDYLLKPITRPRFDQAVERACAHMHAGRSNQDRLLSLLEAISARSKYLKRLSVKRAGGIAFIDVQDVAWIKAAENYVEIHTGSSLELVHTPMHSIEAALNPDDFLRIHRSLIVNLGHVKMLEPAPYGEYVFVMRSGARLRSGRSYRQAIKGWAGNPF